MSSETGIIGYCRACGKALVEGDATTADGILYCAEHAPTVHQAATPAEPPLLPPPPSPYTAPHTAPPPLPKPDSHASPPLAFVLGFIPGVGAVYNGQYAKGLMHVVIFGSIISILSSGAARGFEPLFGMMIPTFVFYMAFEAYHTAKKRRDGEAVDEFSGLARTAGPHTRFPVAAVLLIAFGVLFLLDNLDLLKIGRLLRYWPAGLIVLGLYLLYDRITETKHERL
jgi:LiaI-LiaF-like transmembrane region